MFLHGNNGLSRIEGDGEGRILVLKDSYANCFVPYLTANFAQIDVVDFRNYNYGLDALDADNHYDQVLVLYSFDSFKSDPYFYRASIPADRCPYHPPAVRLCPQQGAVFMHRFFFAMPPVRGQKSCVQANYCRLFHKDFDGFSCDILYFQYFTSPLLQKPDECSKITIQRRFQFLPSLPDSIPDTAQDLPLPRMREFWSKE